MSVGSVVDVVAGVLVLAGALLALTAGIGVARLGDVFARMHAATKPATLGLVLVVAGAALRVSDLADAAKLGLVVVLQFLTAPVGAHLIGRAALRAGAPHEPFVLDERDDETDVANGPDHTAPGRRGAGRPSNDQGR